MKDNRKNPRYDVDKVITVYDRNTGDQVGTLANVSSDGVMLAIGESFKVNQIYKLRLLSPEINKSVRDIDFDAICVWKRGIGTPELRIAGFKLLSTSPEFKKLIKRLIANASKKAGTPSTD